MAELDTESAAELAVLKEQLAALRRMRGAGVLIAMHGGTQIQYRSITDLNKAISAIKSEIRQLVGSPRRPAYIVQSDRGY